MTTKPGPESAPLVGHPESANNGPHLHTAGQLLHQARTKVGMHLAFLSVTLKVPVRQLEALEADNLDPGKGPVFYRGLASSICRQLQIDPAPVLALLPTASAEWLPLHLATKSTVTNKPLRMSDPARGRLVSSKVMVGAGAMLLLIGALLWLPGPSQWLWLDDVKSFIADDSVSPDVIETPAMVTPSVQLINSDPGQATLTQPSPVAPRSADGPLSPVAAPSPSPNLPAPSAALDKGGSSKSPQSETFRVSQTPEWVFTATGDSWLEVRNLKKEVVWSGMVKAGESTRIQTPLPVSVVVGRAQMVSVTLRGQPFDLKPHTQVTVARFEVKE